MPGSRVKLNAFGGPEEPELETFADIPPETMTMEQMISDTIEVAVYLRDRFGQDSILLFGHSWGAYLGMQVAATAPDRFRAYVVIAQIAHQLRSEVMVRDYILDAYRGKLWSRQFFWEDLLRDNLSARLTDFDLPVYFFAGRHDYTANAHLPRAYFDGIEAPVKGFYLFEGSAHSPLFEEPERATEILLNDVLRGTNTLADER